MQWFPVQTRRFPLGKRRIPLGIRGYRSGLPVRKFFLFFWVPKQSNIWTCSILEWCMSSLLSYHIFSFFISNIFENFKFGRNFSKFTAGMGCRLVAVSVKIGGNRRLPIGKENTAHDSSLLIPCIARSSMSLYNRTYSDLPMKPHRGGIYLANYVL